MRISSTLPGWKDRHRAPAGRALCLCRPACSRRSPAFAIEQDARIAGEALVPAPGRTVGNDRVARVAPPGLQVGRCRHAGLFAPFAGQILRLGVVEKVVRAPVLHQAGLIEAAVSQSAPSSGRRQGFVDLPAHQVVAPAESDDRGPCSTRVRVGVIDAEEAARGPSSTRRRRRFVLAHDPVHCDVVAGHRR